MKMLPVNDLARTWCVEVAAGSSDRFRCSDSGADKVGGTMKTSVFLIVNKLVMLFSPANQVLRRIPGAKIVYASIYRRLRPKETILVVVKEAVCMPAQVISV